MIYTHEIKTPLRTVKGRKITVFDFIDRDLKINLFDRKTAASGMFARFEDQEKKEDKELELSIEEEEFIDSVLNFAVEDYKEQIETFLQVEKLIVFNQIIQISSGRVKEVLYPKKDMALMCHFMAKNYGGEPWDYINADLERFLFNAFCYNVGAEEEIRILNKNKPKKR